VAVVMESVKADKTLSGWHRNSDASAPTDQSDALAQRLLEELTEQERRYVLATTQESD
jgi:hypothetical protein